MALLAGGWALAPDDADAVAVAAAYSWGTGCLVYADGDSTGALGNGGETTPLWRLFLINLSLTLFPNKSLSLHTRCHL